MTFVVTPAFLDHFGLESERGLPGIDELRAAGLLDNRPGAVPLLRMGDGGEEGDLPAGDATDQEEMFP